MSRIYLKRILTGSLFITSIATFSIFISSCKNSSLSMENTEAGVYQKQVFKNKSGDLNYRIFYPEKFDPKKKYPLLLFMHGAGERGNDNEAQLIHGSKLIADGMNKHNAIAIFPQCPEDDYWVKFRPDENDTRSFNVDTENGPSEALSKVIDLIEKKKEMDYIDKSKMYVAGLSMGGMATFDLLWRMPNTFAAAMPICGAGSPEKAVFMKSIPIRIFHGEEDGVVPFKKSKEMENAIKAVGGNPETYYYPGVNHDSWTNAFEEKDFLSWLFDQELIH